METDIVLIIECHYCGSDMLVRKLTDYKIEAKCLTCKTNFDNKVKELNRLKRTCGNFIAVVVSEFDFLNQGETF
jgi:DNA-directed RNA polymerase subunit RPC12/RpoP